MTRTSCYPVMLLGCATLSACQPQPTTKTEVLVTDEPVPQQPALPTRVHASGLVSGWNATCSFDGTAGRPSSIMAMVLRLKKQGADSPALDKARIQFSSPSLGDWEVVCHLAKKVDQNPKRFVTIRQNDADAAVLHTQHIYQSGMEGGRELPEGSHNIKVRIAINDAPFTPLDGEIAYLVTPHDSVR